MNLKAELICLRRPVVMALLLAVAVLCVSYIVMFQEAAAWSAEHHGKRFGQALDDIGSSGQVSSESESQTSLYEEVLSSLDGLSALRPDLSYVASTQTPLGCLGASAGLMCSGIGFFALLVLAGVHVAGEWQRKTIKEFYRGRRQALDFVLSKFVSLFLMGLILLVCAWAALALWGIISQRVFPIPFALSVRETWHWVYPVLVGLPVVLFFYAALGVTLGVVLREVAAVIVGGATGFLALSWLSRFEAVATFSPFSWAIACVLSSRQASADGAGLLRSLCSDWSPVFASGQVSGLWATVLLGALSAALLWGSWLLLWTSDAVR